MGIVSSSISWSLTLAGGILTVCTSATDALDVLLPSPPYFAVIEWVPVVSDEVVKAAPPLNRVMVLMAVPPSRNVTAPVGELPVTFAENVTGWPKLLGLSDEDSDIVVTTLKLNWSAEPVALVPPGAITVRSTVPVPAGDVAVIEVALLTVNELAAVVPNFTAVVPMKLVPVTVTLVPGGPVLGDTEVTVGTGKLKVN
jgi:hypothetical protein